ncbi:MAG: glyceraldehyde 3-phosphate dehydrogenase NAD-binding domain-containing protein [Aquisalimonadaceae bacterium]
MAQRPRVAINGYGRIGRCVLRALHEQGAEAGLQVVAINEPEDLDSMVYLTRFDSTHGRFPGRVEEDDGALLVDGRRITVTHGSRPEDVDWRAMGIDLVLECSGSFGDRATAERYLAAGVPRLLLSNPMQSSGDTDATVVMGINEGAIADNAKLVSNASCTTNCIVPILRVLDQALGVEAASVTTLHSAMNDQPVLDGYHRTDLRRTRSAMHSIIPVSTGLARGIERLLPEMTGRVEARHVRVPTINVSAMDAVLQVSRDTDVDEVNRILRQAAEGDYAGLMAWTDLPHASCDFNHDPHSSIVDITQTRVSGRRLVSLLAWFDNEWAFASRMVDVAVHWSGSFR